MTELTSALAIGKPGRSGWPWGGWWCKPDERGVRKADKCTATLGRASRNKLGNYDLSSKYIYCYPPSNSMVSRESIACWESPLYFWTFWIHWSISSYASPSLSMLNQGVLSSSSCFSRRDSHSFSSLYSYSSNLWLFFYSSRISCSSCQIWASFSLLACCRS